MATELSNDILSILDNHNAETVKIKPVDSGLVKEPDEQNANYWKIASDMALSVPQGIVLKRRSNRREVTQIGNGNVTRTRFTIPRTRFTIHGTRGRCGFSNI